MKLYATVSLAGTIDDMVNALDERYGFTPPLADFVVNDPYRKFSTQIQSSLDKGKEAVNGLECDHLTLTGEIADADVWISIADHLPRRFVATFKDREGSPQLKVDFSDWNLAATLRSPPSSSIRQLVEKIIMAAIRSRRRPLKRRTACHERESPSVLIVASDGYGRRSTQHDRRAHRAWCRPARTTVVVAPAPRAVVVALAPRAVVVAPAPVVVAALRDIAVSGGHTRLLRWGSHYVAAFTIGRSSIRDARVMSECACERRKHLAR
jgi:hypothetical protein